MNYIDIDLLHSRATYLHDSSDNILFPGSADIWSTTYHIWRKLWSGRPTKRFVNQINYHI